jgi:hypothetical protein
MADDDDELPTYWNYWTMPEYKWASGEERLQEEYFHRGEGNGMPDMAEWARRSWTEVEATALTFGKDPEEVDHDSINPDIPFSRYFRAILNRINRAQEAGELPHPIPPNTYVRWAKQNGIDVPPSLLAIVVDLSWITKLFEDNAKLPRALTRMRMERNRLLRENEALRNKMHELEQQLKAEIQELKQRLAARGTKPMPQRENAQKAIVALWPDGVPSRAELRNIDLVKQVGEKMKAMGLKPPQGDITKTIKRAAGRLR